MKHEQLTRAVIGCAMIVADVVLIEMKAGHSLARAHDVQLVNYLAATEIEVGLLINFGASRLEVKRRGWGQRTTATAFSL